ncbi:MAG: HlyD family efflux transporter periplasmic adaptor subunit [Lentisphaeria bacterium]|nr:HlyD family efflux transporter periplasmic adaptor subunit [Lentisphaeria bacterium]
MKKIVLLLIIAAVAGIGFYLYKTYEDAGRVDASRFASGNGRLEATEVSIAAKLAGRIEKIMVDEGDFISEKQPLAQMQTNVLEAQLAQAKAQRNQAVTAEAGAKAMIDVRVSEKEAARATVLQKESSLDGARKRYERSKVLSEANAASRQQFEDDETAYLAAKAEVAVAEAGVKQAEAAINSAKAEAAGAAAAIAAAEADMARIQADIDDSLLIAPREGRIQYRIAQPGEVLSAGGRVLNLVDLTDVYMTFFLPEEVAGKVAIGAEVRLILDAVPDIPIPAEVSYVASVAQFTPKTVETQSERQKLMFRVKARIDPALLKKYIKLVKTGIPGVAWVKIDPEAAWPEFLTLKKKP